MDWMPARKISHRYALEFMDKHDNAQQECPES